MTTPLREKVLQLVREERAYQVEKYGTNDDLFLGFGSSVSAYPWLTPYSLNSASQIEATFRQDYEAYEKLHGKPTWMHLIREEVAELFEAKRYDRAVSEAIQVAALCVSLVENLLAEYEGEQP